MLGLEVSTLETSSWVLDIDSYVEKRMPFTPDEVTENIRDLADRAYRMFRWVVNPEFIEYFGGSDG